MAGGSQFFRIHVLLFSVLQASFSTHGHPAALQAPFSSTGNAEVDRIISQLKIPIGTDYTKVNVTSITIKTCEGAQEQVASLNERLQKERAHSTKLNVEAFRLRSEVRLLKLKLGACSATSSVIVGNFHTQLQNQLNQLLAKSDSHSFLTLKIAALTRDVTMLQRTAARAANSTSQAALQTQLEEKRTELRLKTQQMERSTHNSLLILEIISLQNDIWDLEEAESRRGASGSSTAEQILELQGQLDNKIRELRDEGDGDSDVLELIFVHSNIEKIQKLIDFHTEKARTRTTDFQRQWKQTSDLVKKKILQLNREVDNTELTEEVLKLQAELVRLETAHSNSQKATEATLKKLRATLDENKKRQDNLTKQLETSDPAHADTIIKIISIMKEVRDLHDGDHDDTTGSSQAGALQTLLQNKEREYAKVQDEIKELKRKLQSQSSECSGLKQNYDQLKTESEDKIAELNRAGESKAALVLEIINLNGELEALRGLITVTDDQDKITELQRQLEEKQQEMTKKTTDLQGLGANPEIFIRIIELQNEIWHHQKEAANKTTGDQTQQLQQELDSLISKIQDQDKDSTKLSEYEIREQKVLKIITLQSQVEHLKRQLAHTQSSQTSQINLLTNQLRAKTAELDGLVNELKEKNEANANLILEITNLQNQLRKTEKDKDTESKTSSAIIAELRGKLRAKEGEHSRAQAQIDALQIRLNQTEERCSDVQKKREDLQNDLNAKMQELEAKSDTISSLVLGIINLNDELGALRDLINRTDEPDKISELQRQLAQKQHEVTKKTTELQRLNANPEIFIRIIELQNDIWHHQKGAASKTTDDQTQELQKELNSLINRIEDKDKDSTKLMLKIITLQSQVEHLKRQLAHTQSSQTSQINLLTNQLRAKTAELDGLVNELRGKNEANANLILEITNLQNQLRKTEKDKDTESKTSSAIIAELRGKLRAKEGEHSRAQAQIDALQIRLNQTEERCSDVQKKREDLQNDLDAKMQELEAKSDTISSLVLQVSTLTQEVEALNKQKLSAADHKMQELQRIIDEKNQILAKKTEELKAKSTQPERFLQIITLQTQIEKMNSGATTPEEYEKIAVLQNYLNSLIDRIENENNEATKEMCKMLSLQDETETLKKQLNNERETHSAQIEGLQNELEEKKAELKDKTAELATSQVTVANISAQIIALHREIKRLESEISFIKEAHAAAMAELEDKLKLREKQLQDSQRLFKESDTRNFQLMMDVADLRAQLRKAQSEASKATIITADQVDEMQKQLKAQEEQINKLKKQNNELKEQKAQLETVCSNANQCDEIQAQLTESQEDANRLLQQLQEKDASLKQLQMEKNNLQHQHDNLDAENRKLQKLVQDLNEQTRDVDDKTIHPITVALDPETAHPRLILSADGSELTVGAVSQDVPDSAHRFNVALAVLGKTGFSKGRHYWEVSVAGHLCFNLGMASESANRRGALRIQPRYGFWTLIKNKQGQYGALDTRAATIALQQQPIRLGILLDYEKGQISFYDAGTRAHIYSFVGQTFTDKIYPFINACVDDNRDRASFVFSPAGTVDWIQ